MDRETFERFRDLIYKESGIVLPPAKQSLLEARIGRRLRELNIGDESEYLNIVELDVSGDEIVNLIDAVSTNVTYFYREAEHFTQLRQIVSGLCAEGKEDIRIWCAAASSGEEPYTIAFETLEAIGKQSTTFKILATDICTKVLRRAVEGVYHSEATKKVPQTVGEKYFEFFDQDNESMCRVLPKVQQNIAFKKLNLVHFPYPLRGPIDIIFCRNVMIYFDRETRQRIVREFERLLPLGGWLFLSLSENLFGIEHSFEKSGPSVFRKV